MRSPIVALCALVALTPMRSREVHAATLAVGELPACLTDHLEQPGGHAGQQVAQAKLVADRFGFVEIGWARRPGTRE